MTSTRPTPDELLGRFVLELLPDPVLVFDRSWSVVTANRAAREFEAHDLEQLLGGTPRDPAMEEFAKDLQLDGYACRELPLSDAKAADRFSLMGFALQDHLLLMVRDSTDPAPLQRELHQYRRVRTLGLVTARFAHDLNNLLTPILLFSRELAETLPPHDSLGLLRELEATALRAVAMVKDVLEFTRPRGTGIEVVSVNSMVLALRPLLSLLLGNTVILRLSLDEGATYVRVHRSRFEQALLNLVTNSKAAMPHGGELTITTANVLTGQEHDGEGPLESYVALVVNDTGIGMTEDVRARAFDDFFTTRAARGGTGLGLGSVRQFVRDSAGLISIESEVGRGTSVIMHLPRAEPARLSQTATPENHDPSRA